jgi:hypothetical protein
MTWNASLPSCAHNEARRAGKLVCRESAGRSGGAARLPVHWDDRFRNI